MSGERPSVLTHMTEAQLADYARALVGDARAAAATRKPHPSDLTLGFCIARLEAIVDELCERRQRDRRVEKAVAFAASEFQRVGHVQDDDAAPKEFPAVVDNRGESDK